MTTPPYSVVEWAGVYASTKGRAVAAMLMRGETIVADFFDPKDANAACSALNAIEASPVEARERERDDVAAIIYAAARTSRAHHAHEDKSALLHALVVEIPALLESALERMSAPTRAPDAAGESESGNKGGGL